MVNVLLPLRCNVPPLLHSSFLLCWQGSTNANIHSKSAKSFSILLGLTYSCSFFGYSAILNIFGKFWQNVPKIPGEVFPDVVGPRSWDSTSNDPILPPMQTTIPLNCSRSRVDLLATGRHVVCYLDGGVEFWDLHSGCRVWSWNKTDHTVARAAFDFRPRESSAMAGFRASPVGTDTAGKSQRTLIKGSLEFLCPDKGKKSPPIELFRIKIDRLGPAPGHQISGDLLAYGAYYCSASHPQMLLINWRTEEFITFDVMQVPYANYPTPPTFVLTSGYLFPVKVRDVPEMNGIEIYSIPSLDPFWRPLSRFGTTEPLHHPRPSPHVLSVPGNDGNYRRHNTTLAVAECPIHYGAYDLTVEVQDVLPLSPEHYPSGSLTGAMSERRLNTMSVREATAKRHVFRILSWFHVRLDPIGGMESRLLSTFRHSAFYAHPSGAGYALAWDGMLSLGRVKPPEFVQLARVGVLRLDGEDIEKRKELEVNLNGENPSKVLMAHTGTVVAVYESKMVVSRFLV
ncbi:hypothetical protein FB45DRAFT_862136 [Roridomyces roridus]|uniref:Uncharacterized protein n=1 Tax=Roridomyces roridus TaxID=1738132 RepID=A0AAD7CD06_9AGAR|nr:hypothetical protein FB45DRAFT_862136 [Roridomyces roridus]